MVLWKGTAEAVPIKPAKNAGFGVCAATQLPMKNWNATAPNSREAAAECSPRRKPWVESRKRTSPSGAKDQLRHSLFSP